MTTSGQCLRRRSAARQDCQKRRISTATPGGATRSLVRQPERQYAASVMRHDGLRGATATGQYCSNRSVVLGHATVRTHVLARAAKPHIADRPRSTIVKHGVGRGRDRPTRPLAMSYGSPKSASVAKRVCAHPPSYTGAVWKQEPVALLQVRHHGQSACRVQS